MVGARVRRQQVASARRRGLSSRRACAVLSVARSTLGYQSRLQQRDAPALAVMRELAGQYPRYGYRKIRIFLRTPGTPDECRTDLSTVAPGGPASAASAPAAASGHSSPSAAASDREESRVGL